MAYAPANGDAEFGKNITCVNILSNALLKQLNLFSINTCYRIAASQGFLRALTVEKIYLDTSAKTYLEELATVFSCRQQRPSSTAALDKQWLGAIAC